MSELGDDLKAHGDLRKARRAAFGVNCPMCKVRRPKAHPTILLHQQRCRVDGYRDPRPYPSEAEEAVALAPYGFMLKTDQEKGHAK